MEFDRGCKRGEFIWTARCLFGVRRPFPHLTILACVAALLHNSRALWVSAPHYKSAAAHSTVTHREKGGALQINGAQSRYHLSFDRLARFGKLLPPFP